MVKVGLDAGHGGYDTGAIGPTGLKEKDVTLDITLMVDKLLRDAGLQIVLTRDKDTALARPVELDLRARTDILNRAKADYAVSIHINSSVNKDADYISTYIVARGGEAEKLAKKVQGKLVEKTGWADGGVRVRNFHMVRVTRMPAILVECGFISNFAVEGLLRQAQTREKLAEGIAEGVLGYLGIGGEINVDAVKVLVKGQELEGKLIDGVTYVPLREFVEVMNNQVRWFEGDKLVVVE